MGTALESASGGGQVRGLGSLAESIRGEHEACERDARSAVEHAIKAGELLIEAKAAVKHGEWLPWLEANFPAAQQTANGYMRIAANYGGSRDLPVSVNAALAELAEPRISESAPPSDRTGESGGYPDGVGEGASGRLVVGGDFESDDAEVVDGEVVDPPRAAGETGSTRPPEPAQAPTPTQRRANGAADGLWKLTGYVEHARRCWEADPDPLEDEKTPSRLAERLEGVRDLAQGALDLMREKGWR